MPLILASSFMKQLKRLQQKEQGVVSRTVLEMQMDATAPTLSIHRVDGGEGWWSAYANGDLRIIFSRAGEGGMVLCWTDHHDSAYLWARRHKLEKHPVTGSMQIVEIPEVVEHNEVPGGGQGSARPTVATRPICAKLGVTRNELLGWGVPELWAERVLAATSEDELLDIGEKHLPPDAAEAVLSIAVGERPSGVVGDGTPTLPEHGETTVPSQSVAGDAAWNGQSWWVISDDDDLKSALENLDWDSWCVYLHPAQRKIAYRLYEGPRRVCGSAGTGKTVVALHHAKHLLAEVPDARVLITTFSLNLVRDLKRRCVPLMGARLLERCKLDTLVGVALELFNRLWPDHPQVLSRTDVDAFAWQTLNRISGDLPDMRDSARFVLSEFERVVEPRQIKTEEQYLKAQRRGVHTRLAATRRTAIWTAIKRVYDELETGRPLMTTDQMIGWLATYYREHPEAPRYYSHIVVDECQDLSENELDFLMAYLGGSGNIFFAGDIGQRIVRYSFPWKPHGVDLRGRSRVLKVNYRTTHEIRSMADRLMTTEAEDADGVAQDRRGTVSLLTGPRPEIRMFATPEEEVAGVAAWLTHLGNDLGVKANEVALFYRSEAQSGRARKAIAASVFKDAFNPPLVAEMFAAKGLEYRAAVVMACDNGVIPSPERLAEADLVAGLEEIYNTERNLLYVACTRARDYLLITCGGVPSEFLLDMKS